MEANRAASTAVSTKTQPKRGTESIPRPRTSPLVTLGVKPICPSNRRPGLLGPCPAGYNNIQRSGHNNQQNPGYIMNQSHGYNINQYPGLHNYQGGVYNSNQYSVFETHPGPGYNYQNSGYNHDQGTTPQPARPSQVQPITVTGPESAETPWGQPTTLAMPESAGTFQAQYTTQTGPESAGTCQIQYRILQRPEAAVNTQIQPAVDDRPKPGPFQQLQQVAIPNARVRSEVKIDMTKKNLGKQLMVKKVESKEMLEKENLELIKEIEKQKKRLEGLLIDKQETVTGLSDDIKHLTKINNDASQQKHQLEEALKAVVKRTKEAEGQLAMQLAEHSQNESALAQVKDKLVKTKCQWEEERSRLLAEQEQEISKVKAMLAQDLENKKSEWEMEKCNLLDQQTKNISSLKAELKKTQEDLETEKFQWNVEKIWRETLILTKQIAEEQEKCQALMDRLMNLENQLEQRQTRQRRRSIWRWFRQVFRRTRT